MFLHLVYLARGQIQKVLVFAPLYRRALVLGLVPFSLYGPFSTCYAPATYRALSHLTFEAQ